MSYLVENRFPCEEAYCNFPKFWTFSNKQINRIYHRLHRVIPPKDTDGIATSGDPDQTAPSALVGQIFLCKKLGGNDG